MVNQVHESWTGQPVSMTKFAAAMTNGALPRCRKVKHRNETSTLPRYGSHEWTQGARRVAHQDPPGRHRTEQLASSKVISQHKVTLFALLSKPGSEPGGASAWKEGGGTGASAEGGRKEAAMGRRRLRQACGRREAAALSTGIVEGRGVAGAQRKEGGGPGSGARATTRSGGGAWAVAGRSGGGWTCEL
nr:uncharacterized protein LOC4335622 isoform X2 [Oryza sativa Japonica Group]